jgi:hypothetical protein
VVGGDASRSVDLPPTPLAEVISPTALDVAADVGGVQQDDAVRRRRNADRYVPSVIQYRFR